jgi:hypothetical protein
MRHPFADAVILTWIPFSLVLFTLLRPRHAVLVSYLGAWLFLPQNAGLVIRILPDIDKVTAASMGVLLGVMLFDAARLFSFRFRWFDLPALVFCFMPFLSSVTNGAGYWDGLSSIIDQTTVFGIPYYLGRVYFTDWEGFRELAIAIFLGGVIYIPFCLFEVRMSPQLHRIVYGYHQHFIGQTYRMGGYRPMVFMQHGLAVGFWMTAASLIGVWLLATGSLRQVLGVPLMLIVPFLLVTTVLCKSLAGLGFLFVGIVALFFIKWTKWALPLYLLIAVPPVYMVVRASGVVDGTQLVQLATDLFGEERAQSLGVRIHSENVLSEHALKRPLFGYGRWSPNSRRPPWMPLDTDTGKRSAIPDGMWVLTLAQRGVFALAALTAMVLLPPILLRWRVGPQWWGHPMAAPAAACAVLLTLHMGDNLLNAMVNPLFICVMGGLTALGTQQIVPQRRGFPIQPPPQMPGQPYQPMIGGAPRRQVMPPPPNRPMPRPAPAGR